MPQNPNRGTSDPTKRTYILQQDRGLGWEVGETGRGIGWIWGQENGVEVWDSRGYWVWDEAGGWGGWERVGYVGRYGEPPPPPPPRVDKQSENITFRILRNAVGKNK